MDSPSLFGNPVAQEFVQYTGEQEFKQEGSFKLPKHVVLRERQDAKRRARDEEDEVAYEQRRVRQGLELDIAEAREMVQDRNENLNDRMRAGKGYDAPDLTVGHRVARDLTGENVERGIALGFKHMYEMHRINGLAWTGAVKYASYVMGWEDDVAHWRRSDQMHYNRLDFTHVVNEQMKKGYVVNEGKVRCPLLPVVLDIGAICKAVADGMLLNEHGFYVIELMNIAFQGWRFEANSAVFAYMRDLKFIVNVGLATHLFKSFHTRESLTAGHYYDDAMYVWRCWKAIRNASDDWVETMSVSKAAEITDNMMKMSGRDGRETTEMREALAEGIFNYFIQKRIGKTLDMMTVSDMFFPVPQTYKLPLIIVKERLVRLNSIYGIEYGVIPQFKEVLRTMLDEKDNEILEKRKELVGFKFEDIDRITHWEALLKIRPFANPGHTTKVGGKKISVGKSFGLMSYMDDDKMRMVIFGNLDPNVQYHENNIKKEYINYFGTHVKTYGFDFRPMFAAQGVSLCTGSSVDRNVYIMWKRTRGVYLFMNVDLFESAGDTVITYVS